MKDFLKKIKINYSLIAFFAYSIKLLILEASYADALVLACLAGLYGYKMRLKLAEPRDVNEDVRKEIAEIKTAMSKVNLAKISEIKKYF